MNKQTLSKKACHCVTKRIGIFSNFFARFKIWAHMTEISFGLTTRIF